MKSLLLALLIVMVLALPACAGRIICASTTSTQNSGLFDHLLPMFEEKTGIDVHVIAVGTGAAIEIGKRGDADVVFVHARELELQAVREGHFVNRRDVMYNDFVLVGPLEDAEELSGVASAAGAFREIASLGRRFVSRGDNSGTHRKELFIWKEAGVSPRGRGWYLEVGQGMSKTLRIANEKRAFTLTDRGTWLALADRGSLELAIAFEGDPMLFNQYGVMAVNPDRHPGVKYEEAMRFVDWLFSDEGQRAIGSFRDSTGNRLFTPNAGK